MPLKLNRDQVAQLLGIHFKTVGTYIARDGLPVEQRGGQGVPWVFDLIAVHKWDLERQRRRLEARLGDPEPDPVTRLAMIRADRAELELAQSRGEMVTLDEVSAMIRPRLIETRQRLEAMIAPTAHKMAGRERGACVRILRRRLTAALNPLETLDEMGSEPRVNGRAAGRRRTPWSART